MIEEKMGYIQRHREENKIIREYFETCMDRINQSNQYMLRKVCMYVAIVYVIMMPAALLFLPGFKITPLHWGMLPLLVVYYFINLHTRTKPFRNTHVTGFVCCGFFFFLSILFIFMDINGYSDGQAYWVPMLALVFPVLYIDRMYKYGFEELLALIIFWWASYHYRSPELFHRDLYITVASYIISMFVAHISLELRSREGLAEKELMKLSSLDKLTHVLNKGALLQKVDYYLLQKPGYDYCAMVIIDLDDFKNVNDNLGHGTGDIVLERVGQLLIDNFRACDMIGRYGGDEFVVVLPQMGDETILQMRCRTLQMFLTDFSVGNGKPFSVSIGGIISKDIRRTEDIFRLADDALYKSKLGGKNRCTIWSIAEKIYDKPILITMNTGNHPENPGVYIGAEDRFDIISTRDDNETLMRISQYHTQVKLIVLEVEDENSLSIEVLNYLKARTGFSTIPVLALATTPEASFIAKEKGADEVIMLDSSNEDYKNSIKQLVSF